MAPLPLPPISHRPEQRASGSSNLSNLRRRPRRRQGNDSNQGAACSSVCGCRRQRNVVHQPGLGPGEWEESNQSVTDQLQ